MKKRFCIIFLTVSLLSSGTVMAQDTLVGWTFPDGTKNAISNIGNWLNLGGMFIEADSIYDIPFTPSISFAYNGYTTKSASTVLWDHAKDLKCWKFSCDATGYKNLKIYARVSSDSNNPGPRDFKIQYRLGCCSPVWKDVPGAMPFTAATDWTTGFVNGVEIPEDADSMPGFQVRFLCTSDTATDGTILSKTSRSLIDEVYVTGNNMTSIDITHKTAPTIEIYPNPASDLVFVKSGKTVTGYNLIGLDGKIIKSDMPHASDFSINCSDLKPGLYFILVNITGNYQFWNKLLIE